MTNLFDAATADKVKVRLAQLTPGSTRQWGKMSVAQMLEHCARSMEWAVGDSVPPPVALPLRVIGRVIKPFALKEKALMRRDSPTALALIVEGEPEFEAGRARLIALMERFVAGGVAGCTTQPHAFFGKMTAQEWAVLTYKHLDHHLRQFGV